jgi:hypothetical protein
MLVHRESTTSRFRRCGLEIKKEAMKRNRTTLPAQRSERPARIGRTALGGVGPPGRAHCAWWRRATRRLISASALVSGTEYRKPKAAAPPPSCCSNSYPLFRKWRRLPRPLTAAAAATSREAGWSAPLFPLCAEPPSHAPRACVGPFFISGSFQRKVIERKTAKARRGGKGSLMSSRHPLVASMQLEPWP